MSFAELKLLLWTENSPSCWEKFPQFILPVMAQFPSALVLLDSQETTSMPRWHLAPSSFQLPGPSPSCCLDPNHEWRRNRCEYIEAPGGTQGHAFGSAHIYMHFKINENEHMPLFNPQKLLIPV